MGRWLERVGHGVGALALPVVLAVTATAGAAGIPVYHDPPDIKPLTHAPALAPLPTPPAIPLAQSGTFPDVLVDDAGTAHIVWNDGRGDADDATMYCRLKRGATSCDGPPVQLLWNKSYGNGDSPAFNVDNQGPRILQVGDQLVVLSQRYPTGSEKPDGTSSSNTVLAWTSSDGGQTWTEPAIQGRWALGQVGLVPSGDELRIVNLGEDPLCPGMCVEEYRSGEYNGAGTDLATGKDQAYYATLAVTNGIPTGAWGDLSNQIFLRRWNGTGSLMDAGAWTQSPPVPGNEPSLAGGRAGLWLMHRAAPGPSAQRQPFVVRSIADRGGTLVPGAPTTVSTTDDVMFGRLAQDADGRLLTAWEQRQGRAPGVRLRTTDRPATAPVRSAPGAAARTSRAAKPAPVPAGSDALSPGAFGPAQTLIAGAENGQIALAATGDGGGFAVVNHTGGINAAGQIVATAFGAPGATNKPGLGQLPGGAATGKRCDTVAFGSFDIKAPSCLYHGLGANATKFTTGAEVDLFGLKLIPDVGSKLVIDPKALRLDVIGQLTVLVRTPVVGDVVLWHGKLNVDLSAARPGTILFDFPIGEYAANILGFPLGADIKVRLEKDGVHIPMSLQLPPALLGASAQTEFVADREGGLHLNSLHLHLGPVPLGAASLDKFDLVYEPSQQVWQGDGQLTIAGFGSIAASATFKMGAFNGATIDINPKPPVVIGPFVYLLEAGGGFTVDPLHIEVQGTVGGGGAIENEAPVKVHGKLTADFPRTGPGQFALTGDVSLFDFQLAIGQLRYQTDGYADFHVDLHQDFAVLTLNGVFDGFIDATTGDAAAGFSGSVCINFGWPCLAGASLSGAVSSKGLAVCGGASIGDFGGAFPQGPDGKPLVPPDITKGGGFSIGVKFPLKDLDDAGKAIASAGLFGPVVGAAIVLDHIRTPCHTDDYHVPPPRPRQAGGGVNLSVNVPGGTPSQTILVSGTDGLPAVDLVSGVTTIPGATADQRAIKSPGGLSLAVPDANAVLFVLDAPKAGTWTVTPRAGSPGVKEIKQSSGYRVATPKATVRTRGRLHSLAYRIGDLGDGQSVRFVESGAFGSRVVGTATRAAGTVALPAGTLAAGPRTITAEIQKDGMTTDKKVVARYVAARPPVPRAVTGLKVVRHGTTFTVTWRRAAAGAARQQVKLTGAHGTRLLTLVGATSRAARFSGVRADERVTVEVVGLTKLMVRGAAVRTVSHGTRRTR